MVETPVFRVNDRIVLRPATSAVLVAMFEAYQEDAEAAQTALPWLDPNDDVRRQLRDMLYDIEAQAGTDSLHFWSIHDAESEDFMGLVGLVTNCNPFMPISTWAIGCRLPAPIDCIDVR